MLHNVWVFTWMLRRPIVYGLRPAYLWWDSYSRWQLLRGSNRLQIFGVMGSEHWFRKAMAWKACNKLRKIWKSTLSRNLRNKLFQATVESVLLYGCETWTITTKNGKVLDRFYSRMLESALNVNWKAHDKYRTVWWHSTNFNKSQSKIIDICRTLLKGWREYSVKANHMATSTGNKIQKTPEEDLRRSSRRWHRLCSQ